MAGQQQRDPNIFEIAAICQTEETAIAFCQNNGLLPQAPGVGFIGGRPRCTITPNCTGSIFQTHRLARGKAYSVFRCTKCKKRRSLKNGSYLIGGQGRGTWFARIDRLNKPNTKIEVRESLLILWCWALEQNMKQVHKIMAGLISADNHTLVDWYNYIRELLEEQMHNAPPMDGLNQIVQIDESYF